MKWKQLLVIGIIVIIVIIVIGIVGIIFSPELTVDKVGFLEPIVYLSFFNEVRDLCGLDRNKFLIGEYKLHDSANEEFKQLDKSQIKRMAEQLTESLPKVEGKRVALAAAKDSDIMDSIRKPLNEELRLSAKGWRLTRSISKADAIVTGNLFYNQQEQPQALFLFFTEKVGEAKEVPKEILCATSNYENLNITAASKDLAKNLSENQQTLKVALINTEDTSVIKIMIEKNILVTTSILEEMINTTTLTFLDKSDTGKYDTELKKALRRDGDQTRLPFLAKNFKESTGAGAVLIIGERSGGHFNLELVELPSVDTLAIGESIPRPFSITIDMHGRPVAMKNPNGTPIEKFSGLKVLTWEKIKDLKVQSGTEFIVGVRGNITFTHTTGSSKEWKLEDEDGIERIYSHTTHSQIERSIKAKDDHTEYYYNWVE